MHPVETYLRELVVIRQSGAAVPETSYYPALKRLLDEVGSTLKPKVTCIVHLRSQGAGIPDGGLFTADQLRRASGDPLAGQLPARAAIEVKGSSAAIGQVADGEQVARYLDRYGLVLVTNLREFVLVGRGRAGRPTRLEAYSLVGDEQAFWSAALHPRQLAQREGDGLVEYLKRAMLANAPLRKPEDVAWFLASYARDALARVELADVPALERVRLALEETLGLTFRGVKGKHFFRSTLVQTLFYGIFSAWVLWHDEDPDRDDAFDWRTAAYHLQLPVIEALFEQLGDPSKLRALNLMDVLDWAGAALNRVDRPAFFAAFEEGHAVQYFYEPFLEAFDPELRKELGIWYTPREVVKYMVARVDTILRGVLGVPDGLADPRVVVVDPCAGTDAYPLEVLRRIASTLESAGEGALLGSAVKEAAMERVFGFEILPAPYVIAHLQLGLLLRSLNAPLREGERLGMFLTNALTGWERGAIREKRPLPGFPELEAERDAAEHVKRAAKIIVVIGNPPYNGFAGAAIAEERELTTAYRTTTRAPAPQGQGLNDLYVRFFRVAERTIAEHTGRGVVCFISNYSWLDGLSYTGMRERFLEAFDNVWIDSLNGDKYRTGKLTPEGLPDPSIFSTSANPQGIQVGTAIALLVRAEGRGGAEVRYRDFWGRAKRDDLLASLRHWDPDNYTVLDPPVDLGLPFMPRAMTAAYTSWPKLPDLFPVSFPGVKTSRDDVVVDIDRGRLEARMRQYFDPSVSHDAMRQIAPAALVSTARFDAVAVRDHLVRRGFLPERIVRYCYRPFDVRWLYWEPETKLLDEKRSDYMANAFDGNVWLVAQQKPRREWSPAQVIGSVGCLDLMDRGATCIPLLLKRDPGFFTSGALTNTNLTPSGEEYVGQLSKAGAASGAAGLAEALFYHTLAILHAPAYRTENGGALRQDWPRIPLPSDGDTLAASAALGRRMAALLDVETPVEGITSGTIRPELRAIGVLSQMTPGPLDLAVTAGWGHAGQGGVTMPGKGKVAERSPLPEELVPALGSRTLDVYLNANTYWRNVPTRVWAYTMGGYQVIKKWLSYREAQLLGRPLNEREAREVRDTARRIAAIILLQRDLDANYGLVTARTSRWPPG